MTQVKQIRVLIADAHTLVRQALSALITIEPDMEVVGEVGDWMDVKQKVQSLQPDVILLDIMMSNCNGAEGIAEIKQIHSLARILVLTSPSKDSYAVAAIEAGALGYLFKGVSSQQLLVAIRNTYLGKFSLSPMLAQKLVHELNLPLNRLPAKLPLTEREVEVLELVGQGLTNYAIAVRLALSQRTIQAHISNILGKLHLSNRTQAALYAFQEGLVGLDQGSS